jgi:hypothetical protein
MSSWPQWADDADRSNIAFDAAGDAATLVG